MCITHRVSLPEWLRGDLRSTAGNCAWARTPQLTFAPAMSPPSASCALSKKRLPTNVIKGLIAQLVRSYG